ncbi:hypothetical protein EYM_01855 [Ignicoccus islandicus DSM 13165]|uniref:Uncharacterized protein n=1 Tax=Ignicoccus islandicus DSM 13165 TaxID=940295 RepID=A0A0U2WMS5_9CREN|nr:hypothetical protein EYM_01855 [Ignicoccus islandicus DSM 13165]
MKAIQIRKPMILPLPPEDVSEEMFLMEEETVLETN